MLLRPGIVHSLLAGCKHLLPFSLDVVSQKTFIPPIAEQTYGKILLASCSRDPGNVVLQVTAIIVVACSDEQLKWMMHILCNVL